MNPFDLPGTIALAMDQTEHASAMIRKEEA